jgi:hypothetical protein
MSMEIITNWQPRDMHALHELPAKKQAWFDYVGEDDAYTPRFVQYRGEWHDTHDTQTIDPVKPGEYTGYVGWGVKVHPGSPLCLFDSVESDSFFSGLLFRFVGEDQVVVGRYFT